MHFNDTVFTNSLTHLFIQHIFFFNVYFILDSCLGAGIKELTKDIKIPVLIEFMLK